MFCLQRNEKFATEQKPWQKNSAWVRVKLCKHKFSRASSWLNYCLFPYFCTYSILSLVDIRISNSLVLCCSRMELIECHWKAKQEKRRANDNFRKGTSHFKTFFKMQQHFLRFSGYWMFDCVVLYQQGSSVLEDLIQHRSPPLS